ncbi:hypothetical protein AVEN_36248-1 [Araneus ventricosus]|uniref:Uncharacterized protein n=1 Tax=Araneus ventricosus TaxID=182803 RepID=A0A4Y2UZA2_ARAVE|nr:hypothetical protein AVEN_113001-1 [Araneus ventricosus]GBO17617.1 hypothetical protein AVEN_36248-1 [Araneus ventricosus]
MSPLTLKKSRASKGSVSKVSLDRRRRERMCSGDALAIPHFAQAGKTLLPWLKDELLRTKSPRPAVACRILNDSCRYDSSSTEAGVLVAHHRATARPLPKEVRTITGGGTRSPIVTMPTGRRVPSYISGSNSYPCIRGVPPWGIL